MSVLNNLPLEARNLEQLKGLLRKKNRKLRRCGGEAAKISIRDDIRLIRSFINKLIEANK